MVDLWYVRAGGFGAITASPQTNILEQLACRLRLQQPMPQRNNWQCWCAKRGRFVGVSAFLKLSAGRAQSICIAPAVCKIETAPGTAPTPEYTGSLTTLNTSALSAAGWSNTGQAGNQPRYELPEWATHALIVIDGYNINNNGGTLLVDDFHVEAW